VTRPSAPSTTRFAALDRPASGFGGQPGGPGGFRVGDLGDLGDLFGGLFGGRRNRARRGADLETALHLGFSDAVNGVSDLWSRYRRRTPARTCSGRGPHPGDLLSCERCNGRGVLNDDQGPFSLSSVCTVCAGRGSRITTPCASCHGSGKELSSRRVNVRIPRRRGRSTYSLEGQGRPRHRRGSGR
jgi:molecular chaperone DnaJ